MAPGPDDTILRSGDAHPAGEERPGDAIGPYKLVSIIGEGGFGTVWLAERREPFAQRVALKLIKAGMDSKSVLARFEQERQALAVMNHPNIAKVLDGGLTPRGRPYFAMELVKGEPITEFCDARKLSIRARLELFAQACDAVQHAHLKSIVHRDLKPSNILAFDVEGEAPRVKVIDFGVAKAMSQPLTEKSIFTETGQMIGTPEYMSPEQANPSLADIDTRSDVYSLGVLLYELVTGATPFDGKALRSKAYGEIQRILREEEPPTPSARLSTISTKDSELASRIERSRGVAVRQLAADLKSELEWIPVKAMRKEPQNRYQTALDLRREIENYLEGRPVSAGPDSTAYRLRKFLRKRSRAVAIVFGLFAAVLLTQLWQVGQAGQVRRASAIAADAWALGCIATERWLSSAEAKFASMNAEDAVDLYAGLAIPLMREVGRLAGVKANESASLEIVVSDFYEPLSRLSTMSDQELRSFALSDGLDGAVGGMDSVLRTPRDTADKRKWTPIPEDRLTPAEFRRRLALLSQSIVDLQLPTRDYQTPQISGRGVERHRDPLGTQKLWETELGDSRLAEVVTGFPSSKSSKFRGAPVAAVFEGIDVAQYKLILHAQAAIESQAFPSRADLAASRMWKVPLAGGAVTLISMICWLSARPAWMTALRIVLPIAVSGAVLLGWYLWTFGVLTGDSQLLLMNVALLMIPGFLTLAVNGLWRAVVLALCVALAIVLLVSVFQYLPGSNPALLSIYRWLW